MPALRAVIAAAVLLSLAPIAHAHPLDVILRPTLREYFVLGVEHILTGYDHLLFVAGLVIAALELRGLVWTISAFTVAHSLTLGLGLLGVVAPSAQAVELIIALSIAYVGYENLRSKAAPRGRVWLVTAFGLAHGFGFAGAIAEVGLPEHSRLPALALFNLGVEIGQLAVVGALWPLLSLARRRPKVELAVARAVNVVLIVAGVAWTLERSVDGPDAQPAAHAVDPTTDASAALTSQAAWQASTRPRRVSEIAPWMRAVCHALHTLPRERRAACSNEQPGVTLASACENALAASVARGGLEIDLERADECVAAMRARYEGCAWAGARVMPAEPACQSFLSGTIADGDPCGSSLECRVGSHCHGAGPFDRGICGPPRHDGARCELAADPLASYIRAPDTEHPECRGRCVRGRCAESSGS